MLEFEDQLKLLLPDIYMLLNSCSLAVHKSVTAVVLHGSRGLAGGARPDSDIDLSLIVDIGASSQQNLEGLLEKVSRITLDQWKSRVELDLAVVFDSRGCQLKCFYRKAWDETLCSQSGVDCFGLYKIQKGFNGFVKNASIDVRSMYPCLVIWHRK